MVIQESVTKKNLGGNVFTLALADHIAEQFKRKYHIDPQEDRKAMKKLSLQAELTKNVLSTMSTTTVFIESLCEGVDYNLALSRVRFESIIQTKFVLFKQMIDELLQKFQNKKIDKLILCGGSMKMPKLQQSIIEMFPDLDATTDILNTITPDEVIAIGCARQASYSTKINSPKITNISIELNLSINDIYGERKDGGGDGINELIFPKGTFLNAKKIFHEIINDNEKEIVFTFTEVDEKKNVFDLGEVTKKYTYF